MRTDMKTDVTVLEAKLAKADVIQEKAAAYIAKAQPVIDEYNESRDRFNKRAHQVAGELAARGIISATAVNGLVDKLAHDQTESLNLVVKLAEMVQVTDFGKKANMHVPTDDGLDPFEKLAVYGDSRANTQTGLGNVD